MKKIVDNFDLFAEKFFLKPLDPDEFYFLQILVRGKDGHVAGGNNKNRLVKFYTIYNAEQLLKYKNEIIAICRVDNARAYIHPTRRSSKEVAALGLELAAHSFVSQNWSGFKSMYSTACGQSFVTSDKKFIIDLDDIHIGDDKYNEIVAKIETLRGKVGEDGSKIFVSVPTKSGCHLVTHPFDIGEFNKAYPDIDVHKNNPTLLYYEWDVDDELNKNIDDLYMISAEYGRSTEYK